MSLFIPARYAGEARSADRPTRDSLACRASRVAMVVLTASAWLLAACASAPPQAVSTGPFEPLAEGEGFLVVHLDSAFGVDKIDAGRVPIVRNLQPGEYLWVVRMKAGRYRWSAVRLTAQNLGSQTMRIEAVSATKEQEFEFSVEPGTINYPGHLMIAGANGSSGIAAGVEIRNRNHSAMAARKLLRSHSEMMAAHPIHYSGTSEDDFLDFYTRERDRLHREATNSAARTETGR